MSLRLVERFGTEKPVIGMAHFPPLPGSPLYDPTSGMEGIYRRVAQDVKHLIDGGVDALLFCNEGDRPYTLHAGFEGVAAMARVIGQLLPLPVPFGIDFLWDARAALAIAVAAGATFIREVVTGVYDSDMGLWSPNAGELLRYRRHLDAAGIAVFFNITPEYAGPLGRRTPAEVARSVTTSSLPDALLVSGPTAGGEVAIDTVRQVVEAVEGRVPVLVNTGINLHNVRAYLEIADGVIVGTSLKVDGYTWNPVDPQRVKEFMAIVKSFRKG